VAFTLFSWLSACSFIIVVATVVGAVLAGVNQETATAVLDVNQQAKLDGLRAALVVLAAVALLALFAARRISTQQTGSTTG
jgi:hypothetical protein